MNKISLKILFEVCFCVSLFYNGVQSLPRDMALSSDEGLPSQAHLLPNGMVQSHVLKHGNGDSDLTEINISMPKIEITEDDTYMCLASFVADIDMDLVGFNIEAVKGVAHHVAWSVCDDVNTDVSLWNCRSQQGHICNGRAVTFGGWDGWSKGHGKEMFDKDLGVRIGKAANLSVVLLQVHFKSKLPSVDLQENNSANLTLYLSTERRPYTMQRYLSANNGYIPGHTDDFSSETACVWEGRPVTAFRYSIHTHFHGKLVEAYLISNGTTTLIGRESPQGKHHDKFAVIGGQVKILPGDIIATRCIYENKGPAAVAFGMTGADEMCNFDLDFKYNSDDALAYNRAVRCIQDAQSRPWCNGTIWGTNVLCDTSKFIVQ